MVAFYKYDYVFDIVLDFSCFFFIKLSTGKRIVTAFVLSAAYEFETFVQENTERLLFNLLTFLFVNHLLTLILLTLFLNF